MPTFSEPERFLLERWPDARLLEGSMEAVRSKYDALFQKVIDQAQRQQGEMDFPKIRISSVGELGLGKDSWPKKDSGWPSGFYLGSMKLDNLIDAKLPPPWKSVWVHSVLNARSSNRATSC